MSDQQQMPVEQHPWPPYIPRNARILIMGTFPPQPHRWSMNFYYPNRTNDFWRMMGLIYYGNPGALYVEGTRDFDLNEIKVLLNREGIALHDTCHKIRRLRGNASDKFLEVVEPVDLDSLLRAMPGLTDIATTGEKAAGVIAALTGTVAPAVGEYTEIEYGPGRRTLRHWRMPSTSRAYPLPLEMKAAVYGRLLKPREANGTRPTY